MTTILLTGIPKVGKTSLVEVTQAFSRRFYEKDVSCISMGEIVAEHAFELWRTPPERVCNIERRLQGPLRYGAVWRAAVQLRSADHAHAIVDTPMTMFMQEGAVPDTIFTSRDIEVIQALGSIEYLVTVIDDPHEVARKLQGTPYPTDVGEVLKWMGMEVDATTGVRTREQRHLVIPRPHSEETLTKLLNDPSPTVTYLGFPITQLKLSDDDNEETKDQKQRAKRDLKHFRERFQEYSVVVVPLELADMGVTEIEMAHERHRDLNWFVRDADLVIGYFPGEYYSKGFETEMSHMLSMGKPAILIHPESKTLVFSERPTLRFRTAEEFFDAIHQSRQKPEYEVLGRFLDPEQNVPRYAHLRTHAVAVDIYGESGHLLQQQGTDKTYAGKWMLVAGKKKGDQTDFAALHDETWEEVGLRLTKVEPGYRMYPVDYAPKIALGDVPRYVRIFRAGQACWEGTTVAGNHTRPTEVANAAWFTRDKILEMGEKQVVPVTLQYFQELRE